MAKGSLTWRSDQDGQPHYVARPHHDVEVAFDRLVELKLAYADFTSHLDQAWRSGLFRSLDNLLDADEWDFSDELPNVRSFTTFMRMIVHNKVTRRPGLGATKDGKIIASWRHDDDRLVIECFPNDHIRWVASRTLDGEKVSAAGNAPVRFLRGALAPYEPGIWFG